MLLAGLYNPEIVCPDETLELWIFFAPSACWLFFVLYGFKQMYCFLVLICLLCHLSDDD